MSELISIWNNAQLTGAIAPPPFAIPNNPNVKSLKINNQSRYWLLITKTQSSVNVDRIEPFSFLIFPFEPDLSLQVDTTNGAESSLNADHEFVDYSAIHGVIGYMKGSTQFSGAAPVSINGVGSSTMAVSVQNIPTMNLGMGNTVGITGTPGVNIENTPSVSITGTPGVNVTNTPTVNITPGNTITALPTASAMGDASGTVTAANTSQQVLAANGSRRYIFFQNISASTMMINFGNAASAGQGSILLAANGGSISFQDGYVPTDALNVFGDTAGAAFTCKYA